MLELISCALEFRHVQALQITMQENDRMYLEANKQTSPASSVGIDGICLVGVRLPFGQVKSAGMDSGLPHDRKKSLDIAKSLRIDIRNGGYFVANSGCSPPNERIEVSPTHTVLKRNADGCRPSDFRTFADLERTNRWIDKRDFPPLWAPGITVALKRSVVIKTNYHGFKIVLEKRDLSNAFKRVLVRPDCALVRMRQFDGVYARMRMDFLAPF